MGRRRLLALAAGVLWMGTTVSATADDGETGDATAVAVCADDTPETAAAFERATLDVLAGSRIRLRIRCGNTGEPATAWFGVHEGGVVLQLGTRSGERTTRRIPWLDDIHRPLHQTLAAGKATTLALLLESLAADLQAVKLRPLPLPPAARPEGTDLPPLTVATEARPPAVAAPPLQAPPTSPVRISAIPSVTTAQTRLPPPPPEPGVRRASPAAAVGPPGNRTAIPDEPTPTNAPKRGPRPSPLLPTQAAELYPSTTFELDVPVVGVAWMPPDTIAPQLEAGFGWGGRRFGLIAHGLVQLDSNFAIAGRGFHTAAYGIRLGLRRTLYATRQWRSTLAATVAGQLTQLRRDGVPFAETRTWLDAGVGVRSRSSFRIVRHVHGLLALGAEVFPTARTAAIPDGPSGRMNLLVMTVLGGMLFDF